MIPTLIWERYFIKEILKVFILFLCTFYFLYVALDYSTHMQDFTKIEFPMKNLGLYYLFQFIKRANLLIPLALLVATIKVLYTLNTKRELVALQAAGVRLKKLLKPFFLVATFCTLLNYLGFEFFLPQATDFLDRFHDSHFKHSEEGNRKERLHILPLKGGSKLVYQSYDSDKNALFDVIWIHSANDLWRIKYLDTHQFPPLGQYVDHFTRDAQGFFEKKESFDTHPFAEMRWQRHTAEKKVVPFENIKPSELFRLSLKHEISSYERSEILTHFFYKCSMPLLSLLVIISVSPFCVLYSRGQSVFFLYALGLFGYLTFFTLMNACVILGENHVISPFYAIFIPFSACTTAFTWNFFKRIS